MFLIIFIDIKFVYLSVVPKKEIANNFMIFFAGSEFHFLIHKFNFRMIHNSP